MDMVQLITHVTFTKKLVRRIYVAIPLGTYCGGQLKVKRSLYHTYISMMKS